MMDQHRRGAFGVAAAASAVLLTVMASAAWAQNMELVSRYDGFNGEYADVWGEGNFAYVGHYGDGGVHIIDLSNPANPVVADHYRLQSPNQFASAQDLKVHNGLLFVALEADPNDSAVIIDVRDPYNPVQLTRIDISGFAAVHNLFYDNGFLYMADSRDPDVAIIDLRNYDPDNPPSLITSTRWTLRNVGSWFVHDITVKDGRLYACGWDSGLFIYDVSNVANSQPTLLGSTGGNNTHSCWPTDDGRYVVTGEEREGGGIKVYRVTDNGNSVSLAQTDSLALPLSSAYSVHNQLIDGYRLYVSWYQAGVHVYDINPTTGRLEFVGSYDTYSGGGQGFVGCWGVYPFLGTGRILATDIDNGLHVLRLTGAGPECDDIKAFKGKCKGDGSIIAKLVLFNESFDGAEVTFGIDGQPHSTSINGRRAKVKVCCYSLGQHSVTLDDPTGCRSPISVTCD